MKHIISALVENQPGVLARVIGQISGRGFNIHSLNVAPTQDVTTSRITMVVPGNDRVLEQVTKQLNKMVGVIKVSDLTGEKFVDREMVIIKLAVTPKTRSAVIELASLFGAQILIVQNKSLTVQITDSTEKVNSFLELVKAHGILDISRTGVIAMKKVDNTDATG